MENFALQIALAVGLLIVGLLNQFQRHQIKAQMKRTEDDIAKLKEEGIKLEAQRAQLAALKSSAQENTAQATLNDILSVRESFKLYSEMLTAIMDRDRRDAESNRRMTTIGQQLDTVQSDLAKTTIKLAETERKLEEQLARNNHLQTLYEAELEKRITADREHVREADEMRKTIETLRREVDTLRKQLEALKSPVST